MTNFCRTVCRKVYKICKVARTYKHFYKHFFRNKKNLKVLVVLNTLFLERIRPFSKTFRTVDRIDRIVFSDYWLARRLRWMCKRVTSVAHGATRRSGQARTRTDSRNDWRVGPLFAGHRINHTTANFLKLRLNTAFQFIIGTSFCALREMPWRCDTGVVCQSTVGVTSCLYNPPSGPLNPSYWACCSVTNYRHGLKRKITFRMFLTQKRRFSFSF